MKAKHASFMISAAAPNGFPRSDLPEIAFAGRSNVGKSSLINVLVGVPGLAKTSSTPGRTRLINWFRVEPQKCRPIAFVDLPGYGYAKVPRGMRDSWRPLIESYLGHRETLRAAVIIIDPRRGARKEEADLLAWLEAAGVAVIPVATKIDKLSKSKRKPEALKIKRDLGLARAPVLFSALSGEGIADLWREITRRV